MMEIRSKDDDQTTTSDIETNDSESLCYHWTNRETWLIFRHLTEDEPSRLQWLTHATHLLPESADAATVYRAMQQLAQELREDVTAECLRSLPALPADLMKAALEHVVWSEIARAILSFRFVCAIDFDSFFPLGNIVETPGATARIPRNERLAALARHTRTDWGEVDGVDWSENDSAVRNGARIYSEYLSTSDETFLIITEADRKLTTILLPGEY